MRTQAEWNVLTHMTRARRPTSCSTRSFISAAALLVNVIARIEPGWALRSSMSHAMRLVEDPGLARPRPGDDQQRVPGVPHRRLLRLVEALQQLLAARPLARRPPLLGRESLGAQPVE